MHAKAIRFDTLFVELCNEMLERDKKCSRSSFNNGKTHYSFRHQHEFPFELILLKAEVTFKPESSKDMKKNN